jgi:hypothetical protein
VADDHGAYAGPVDDARALRLTFAVRADRIELVDGAQVAMRVPPTDSLEDRGERSGLWVELLDADGVAVFRQDLSPTLLDDLEVFPEDPAGEIVRSPAPEREGAFSVVVPLTSEARRLAVVGSRARCARWPPTSAACARRRSSPAYGPIRR